MLDLEKVADRSRIDRSFDLRSALQTSRLRIINKGLKKKQAPVLVEKIVEKHYHHETNSVDEAKLAAIIMKVLKENQSSPQPMDQSEILKAMESLKEQITSLGGNVGDIGGPSIDPQKLAELQSKAVEQVTENMESSNLKTGKRVILKNTRSTDLANELGKAE